MKRRAIRWAVLVSSVALAAAAVVLAFLLAMTTRNSALLERHYGWLLPVNLALAVLLALVIAIEHDHAGTHAVEDGLQTRACALELRNAALYLRTGVGKLARHLGKRTRETAEFVARGKHRLGAQITSGHFAHPFGEQQQRPNELVAQRDREQQRSEYR